MSKVAIAVPIGIETGGPEALHQLCHVIRGFGVDAYLLPWEGTENSKPIDAYSKYDAPIDTSLSQDTFLVVPETVPNMILKSKKSAIWWLSVDNSPLAKATASNFSLTRNEREPDTHNLSTGFWDKFHSSSVMHLTQSYYAKNFVEKTFDVKSRMLTDYINKDDLKLNSGPSKDLVSFSLKGSDYFDFYREMLNEYNCVQIRDMSKETSMKVLANSRLYIDLGGQPGRDRLPREAALLEAHVMLNNAGAATFYWDTPLSASFKFNVKDSYRAVEKIRTHLQAKPKPNSSQLFYRNWTKGQYAAFKFEVWRFLKSI